MMILPNWKCTEMCGHEILKQSMNVNIVYNCLADNSRSQQEAS